jgi:NADH-quinone oxidoreductase subunit N
MTPWQQLAVLMLIAGFAFKIAAVPLHFYAGDVYQGAATPVTAFLSFVPKISGMTALIKLLYASSGGAWAVPDYVEKLLWVLAVLTMTFGNVLGLLQFNVKRLFAYSSIAHTGYMLVGLTAMCAVRGDNPVRFDALQGVLFYLAAYGIMNAGAFGVLMLLPARDTYGFGPRRASMPATTAETFEDLAGTGRRHPALGLAMAVCCFSLIGLPLTVGFFGKVMLIKPALSVGTTAMNWLVVITMINAAISAAYYLRIVGTMFLRPEPEAVAAGADEAAGVVDDRSAGAPASAGVRPAALGMPLPILLSIGLSVGGTLLFGAILPATQVLTIRAGEGANIESTIFPPGMGADVETAAAR